MHLDWLNGLRPHRRCREGGAHRDLAHDLVLIVGKINVAQAIEGDFWTRRSSAAKVSDRGGAAIALGVERLRALDPGCCRITRVAVDALIRVCERRVVNVDGSDVSKC